MIEEFQLLDGISVPSHVGYYDGKGDPDDFIHTFEEQPTWRKIGEKRKKKTQGEGSGRKENSGKTRRYSPYKEPASESTASLTKTPMRKSWLQESYRKKPRSLSRRHGDKEHGRDKYDGRHPRNLRKVTKDKYETQPEEVLFRDGRRPIPGARGVKSRFLSKSTEKSLPFFKILEGYLEKKDFIWTREADKAFEEIKRYIETLPTLVAPKAGENLIVYLAASKECIINPKGTEFTYALKFDFTATNNEAGYEAVIARLRIAKEMKKKEITVFVDLQLVASQVNGLY
ncbi:reverse transcriptase domain-containing protein [Tanacetum coccineum]